MKGQGKKRDRNAAAALQSPEENTQFGPPRILPTIDILSSFHVVKNPLRKIQKTNR